MKNQIKLRLRE